MMPLADDNGLPSLLLCLGDQFLNVEYVGAGGVDQRTPRASRLSSTLFNSPWERITTVSPTPRDLPGSLLSERPALPGR